MVKRSAQIIDTYFFQDLLKIVSVVGVLLLIYMICGISVLFEKKYQSVKAVSFDEMDRLFTVYQMSDRQEFDKEINGCNKKLLSHHLSYSLESSDETIVVDDCTPKEEQLIKGRWDFLINGYAGFILNDKGTLYNHFYNDYYPAEGKLRINIYVVREPLGDFVVGLIFSAYFIGMLVVFIGCYFITDKYMNMVNNINRAVDRILNNEPVVKFPRFSANSEFTFLVNSLKKMYEEIKKGVESIKQVSDNVSHDLRTPLTRIRNKAVTLRDQQQEADVKVLDLLIDDIDQLISTFDALLRIARIETGSKQREFTEISLSELIKEVVEFYEPLASDKNLDIIENISDCRLVGDRELIFQAFVNVLDNAIKYSEPGGEIVIDLQHIEKRFLPEKLSYIATSDNYVMIKVRDCGKGIAPQNLNKVFTRFYREESSRGLSTGSGLGLSLVHAVMEYHKGHIKLSNRLKGLTVELFFPVVIGD